MTSVDPPLLADPVMDIADAGALGRGLMGAIRTVLAGKEDAAGLAVASVLGGGHLLVDDVPGVGKTLLAQSLAAAIGGSFRRIQGTPDLLPGDVIGSIVPDDTEGHRLRFRPGPIFANVVVFDEINRTSPRTQAALLESAEERTVSVDGHTHPLPAPFLLLATQNPVEMAGTFPLGEGALDRFACTISMGRADAGAERDVLLGRAGRDHLQDVQPLTDPVALMAAQGAVRRVHVAEAVAEYVVRLLHATRQHPKVRLGVSTRGGLALVRLAQAHAALDGRDFVTPDDVQTFGVGALAHRTVLEHARGLEPARSLITEIMASTPVPRG